MPTEIEPAHIILTIAVGGTLLLATFIYREFYPECYSRVHENNLYYFCY